MARLLGDSSAHIAQGYGPDGPPAWYSNASPTKVTRTALQNASSVAILLLTSDALVAEKPKEEKAPAGPPGGEEMY